MTQDLAVSMPVEQRLLMPVEARRESLTALVYESIRDGIVSKLLSPGTRLSEAALADQLGVSKTPVREALVRLAAVGLVESDGVRGVRVVTPSVERIRHAYEVRSAHEVTSARLAAERADPAGAESIEAVARDSVERALQGDAPGFRECDAIFHRSVAVAARNPLLLELLENSFSLTWALRRRDAPVTGDSVDCAHQHVAIAAAIRDHDGRRAADAMLAHIDKVMHMVLAALETSSNDHR